MYSMDESQIRDEFLIYESCKQTNANRHDTGTNIDTVIELMNI